MTAPSSSRGPPLSRGGRYECLHIGDQVGYHVAQFGKRGLFNLQEPFVLRQIALLVRGSAFNCPIRTRLSSAGKLMQVTYQWQSGLGQDPVHE